MTKAADEVETARDTLAAAEQQAESNAAACSTAAGSTSTASSTEGVVEGAPPITLPPVTNPALMTSCNGLARQVTQDRARVTQAESAYDPAVAKRQASTGTLEPRLTQVQRELEHTLGREPAGSRRANLASARSGRRQGHRRDRGGTRRPRRRSVGRPGRRRREQRRRVGR